MGPYKVYFYLENYGIDFIIELGSFICFGVSHNHLMQVLWVGVCKVGYVRHEYAMFAGMLGIKLIACSTLFGFYLQGGFSLAQQFNSIWVGSAKTCSNTGLVA